MIVACSNDEEASNGEESNSEESPNYQEPGEYDLPIVNESVTISYAGVDNWYPPASYTDNLPVWQEFEERTGISIDWEVMASSQYDTSMQTRMAAGQDLPDIVAIPPLWGGDIVQYANDGILIPLDELIENYAPNIQSLFEEYPSVKKLLTAPDGHIYNVSELNIGANDINVQSIFIREDWLEKLGLDQPENIDDWYEVLKAFKTKDPNGNGEDDEIPFTSASTGLLNFFGSGFGLQAPVSSYWVNEGNVEYQMIKPEFKELLTFLNKLYIEGLIDPQLSTQGDEAKLDAMISKDIVGASVHFPDVLTRWNNILHGAGVTDANFVVNIPPKSEDGELTIIKRGPLGMEFGITSSNQHPEITMRWIDYLWASEEGVRLANFGIEGKTYEMVDGEPQFTEWVNNHPDGLDPASALRSIGSYPALLGHQTEQFVAQTIEEDVVEQMREMESYLVEPYPEIIPTAEEQERLIMLTSDIDTFVEESIEQFITGQKDIDEFDDFVLQLESLGIDEVIEIKQQQYNRYQGSE